MVVGFDPGHHFDRCDRVSEVEEGFDAGVETGSQDRASFGVERTSEMNHAVGVVPNLQVGGSALPLEPAHTTIGLHASHFDPNMFGEVVDRKALRVGQQAVTTINQPNLVGGRQFPEPAGERIDMAGRDRTISQRRIEPGHHIQRGRSSDHPFRVTM